MNNDEFEQKRPVPTAKEIIDSKAVAYHNMSSLNVLNQNNDLNYRKLNTDHGGYERQGSDALIQQGIYDCHLADVREVMVREPYEPWTQKNLKNVFSGFTTGWYHDRSKPYWKYLIQELLMGIVVVFAQVPETISFAMIAKMDPAMGLHGAWMIGMVSTIFGGRPGMVFGATGSISTVTGAMIAAVAKPRLLFPIVILAGCLMILFSIFNLSFIIRFISKNVMIGFCNGLGIIIALSQLHMFHNAEGDYVSGEIAVHMALMCLCAMIAFQCWALIPYASKYIPSAFVAVGVTLGYEYLICGLWRNIQTTTIGDLGMVNLDFRLPRPFWTYPDYVDTFSYSTKDVGQIVSYGVSFFLVMCLESLMAVSVMDSKYEQPSNADQTLVAIGVANIVSGLLGGMGGNTMVGLSNLLHSAGGCGKEGPLFCSLIVLLTVSCIPSFINGFPTAGLAGIMFVVAGHTFSKESVIMVLCSFLPHSVIKKYPRFARAIPLMDALILLIVTLTVPLMGVDVGIITGVVISSFYFVDKIFNQMRVMKHFATREGLGLCAIYDVNGPLFFSSIVTMEKAFDVENDPDINILRMTHSNIMDYSALEAIAALRQRYESRGKRLIVKNLKKECENKLLRSQARLEWDKDRDHETIELKLPAVTRYCDTIPDLPGVPHHHHSDRTSRRASAHHLTSFRMHHSSHNIGNATPSASSPIDQRLTQSAANLPMNDPMIVVERDIGDVEFAPIPRALINITDSNSVSSEL